MLDKNELIMQGLVYTAMGVLVVFMILVIIMLVIKAMALFSMERKPVAQAEIPIKESVEVPAAQEEKDDTELVAAIVAAIAMVTEKNTSDFIVRSYKKVSDDAWNKAGRREML